MNDDDVPGTSEKLDLVTEILYFRNNSLCKNIRLFNSK